MRPKSDGGTDREYDVSDAVPIDGVATIERGTNVLVSGPSLSERDDIAVELLAAGTDVDQHVILISAQQQPGKVLSKDDRLLAATEEGLVHPVDCSGANPIRRGEMSMHSVSSPRDLTGIGIQIVECTRDAVDAGADGIRLGVLSLSTLLQYSGANRTFNFTHMLCGRTAGWGHLGVWTLDPSAHESTTVNSLRSQFDVAIEVREDVSGESECRVVGVDDVEKTWRSI
jgi:KaiC/GvpD/RAD55 family RecA-like ATPase